MIMWEKIPGSPHVYILECGGTGGHGNEARVSNESHSFGVNTTYYEVSSPSSEAAYLERSA